MTGSPFVEEECNQAMVVQHAAAGRRFAITCSAGRFLTHRHGP
ncbi:MULTISPECIES: hypothetical protein [Kitasatospora]|jgi:hypothetical protein